MCGKSDGFCCFLWWVVRPAGANHTFSVPASSSRRSISGASDPAAPRCRLCTCTRCTEVDEAAYILQLARAKSDAKLDELRLELLGLSEATHGHE